MKKLIILLSLISTIPLIASAQNISDIQASFCNKPTQETNLDVITKANQKTDLCINFKNLSIKDINLTIDFVDGALTPQWSKACFSAEKPKPNFGQHILPYEKTLTLKAQQEIQKTYQIKFPLWFSWVSHWCLAYNIDNSNDIAWWIWLVFRKVHTIDILVWWSEINSNIQTNNISLYSSWFSNRLSINITNNWNIDQTIQLSWIIWNIFWYSTNFITQEQKIKAQESLDITTKINNIPIYKWLFNIKWYISYTPIFNFDITNHNIPTEYITPGTISFSNNIILRNRYYIGIIMLISVLLIRIVVKHKK